MKINTIKEKELLELESELNAELIVNERMLTASSPARLKKYYAYFDKCEVKDEGVLKGVFGDGDTIDEALSDYAFQITGETLIFNAYNKAIRREVIIKDRIVHNNQQKA